MNKNLPFSVGKEDNFFDKLNEWIGDVFYDILPSAGFEERDEQIFMAFQLERSYKEKKPMFAEAGVGTGKTIVYLLYAICYARWTNKPAVIACADESLIEQLVKKEGDIAKIEKHLGLTVDARLAKSPHQYVCLKKLDKATGMGPTQGQKDVYDRLPHFVHDTSGMQSFYPYGDRKDYANLHDDEWYEIAWDPYQDCLSCDKRHRCGQTLTREYYRKSSDIIVCSHDFYMEHVWTEEARKREGQLPLLPQHSSVVFDEGHLLETAAQKALTYRINEEMIENLLTDMLDNDVREELAYLLEDTLVQSELFFETLQNQSFGIEGSDRLRIEMNDTLKKHAAQLKEKIEKIGDALVFESEMYTLEKYQTEIIDEYLDRVDYALSLLLQNNVIYWGVDEESYTLVVMPRTVQEVLAEKVFSNPKPIIFSSATLSQNGSFDYIASSIGVEDYLNFTIESPFNYEENMKVNVRVSTSNQLNLNEVLQNVDSNPGGTLILFQNKENLQWFKTNMDAVNKPIYFEGEKEISHLISSFQNESSTVLCAYSLWEGLDVPGDALSQVIIWSLPFPPNDPVHEAKRKYSNDAFNEVDLPYMILRLRQGIGRLIRTTTDHGKITIYMNEDEKYLLPKIVETLPVEPTINS